MFQVLLLKLHLMFCSKKYMWFIQMSGRLFAKVVVTLVMMIVAWIVVCITITRCTRIRKLPLRPFQIVAIVGNGPSVAKHEFGSQIDACDAVIRFNSAKITPRHTGTKTSIHVITAGSDKSFIKGAERVMVYNCYAHYTRPNPCMSCFLLDSADAIGVNHKNPTSGLVVVAYVTATFRDTMFYMIGFDGMKSGATFSESHYFAEDDQSRTKFDKTFTAIGMAHHSDESSVFEHLVATRDNLRIMSQSWT